MALGRNSDGWYFIMALALASSMSPAIMPPTQARWKQGLVVLRLQRSPSCL